MALDPHTRLFALLDKIEPEYRARFLRLVNSIRDENTLAEIEALLAQGRVLDALKTIQQNLAVFADGIIAGIVTAGVSTADALSGILRQPVSYNQSNAFAVQYMQQDRGRIISNFSQEQERATSRAIASGILSGDSPRAQAQAFVNSIGLTEQQVRHVERYRLLLAGLSRDALERNLRDRRFDSTVSRAIRTSTPLTETQINRMVGRYRQRALLYRADKIARTEALRAVHAGNHEMYRQAIDNGLFEVADIERVWHTAGDSHVRSSHSSMNGQVRGFDEDFITGRGARLRFPGDPSAGAEETAGCRCAVATRISRDLLEQG